jgi:hypothetical protein
MDKKAKAINSTNKNSSFLTEVSKLYLKINISAKNKLKKMKKNFNSLYSMPTK